MMRQRIRRMITLVMLLLFPLTLNYFSPYVSIDGAMNGVISGSLLVFFSLFLSGLFFGRAWCGWLCPMACLSDLAAGVNGHRVNIRHLRVVRYVVFSVWAWVLIAMFVLAGGIRGVNPFHLTERVVSVDEPMKYVAYYAVLFLFLLLSVAVGRRGACHSVCWMSPFLTAGYALGRLARMPQLRVKANAEVCVRCGCCERQCPMSIPVMSWVKRGVLRTSDCILCGECVDHCTEQALAFGIVARTCDAVNDRAKSC